jgi:hypothetical protein
MLAVVMVLGAAMNVAVVVAKMILRIDGENDACW